MGIPFVTLKSTLRQRLTTRVIFFSTFLPEESLGSRLNLIMFIVHWFTVILDATMILITTSLTSII